MDFAAARAELINKLSAEVRDERVLEVMAHVPREHFLPAELKRYAYEDRPLSIGYDQTISQPLIVAIMTEALKLTGGEKVLEIGAGSGYQAAILSRLARKVVTVERVPELARSARWMLADGGYSNVWVYQAEETLGWPREAPYDAIIVTAAAPRVPDGLIKQLAEGGRMVIPVGSRYDQELYKITKRRGRSVIHNLGGCRFVPLIGEESWRE